MMRRRSGLVFICIFFFVCVFLLTGCETLRKKFVRKRKKTQSQEEVILTPRNYSTHPFSNEILYRQYFVYWKSWNQELVISLNDARSHKKIVDCAEQTIVNLKKMSSLLQETKAKELDVYLTKAEDLKTKIIQAKGMPRSKLILIKYKANRIFGVVNRRFDPRKMKEFLKS